MRSGPAATDHRGEEDGWRSDMGVEPTQDGITAPQTVLKTAPVTGPEAAPAGDGSTSRRTARDKDAAKEG